ncbi:hypothetical protein [Niallia sp. Krafla_26]|uniref:hypothetical protein n=1 Tax=Niallia sp. Krafla_26 TaxID=3064703 RepID=UPI003D185461
MKYNNHCECMDENCRTVIVGPDTRLDGISCPRCGGPVFVKPLQDNKKKVSDRALYVRKEILWKNKKHCFDLTPEQIETVLSIGDEYNKKHSYVNDLKCTINIDSKELARLVSEHIKREEKRSVRFNG